MTKDLLQLCFNRPAMQMLLSKRSCLVLMAKLSRHENEDFLPNRFAVARQRTFVARPPCQVARSLDRKKTMWEAVPLFE